MRESRWVRKGTPAVGSIGLGADRVSGRSRVPSPPTRITASTPLTRITTLGFSSVCGAAGRRGPRRHAPDAPGEPGPGGETGADHQPHRQVAPAAVAPGQVDPCAAMVL